jgi:hypothetical protein
MNLGHFTKSKFFPKIEGKGRPPQGVERGGIFDTYHLLIP